MNDPTAPPGFPPLGFDHIMILWTFTYEHLLRANRMPDSFPSAQIVQQPYFDRWAAIESGDPCALAGGAEVRLHTFWGTNCYMFTTQSTPAMVHCTHAVRAHSLGCVRAQCFSLYVMLLCEVELTAKGTFKDLISNVLYK